MRIKALFFASYRDVAGADEISVDLPSGASISDLVGLLRDRGGAWMTLPIRPAVALNLVYAQVTAALADGDEVAFIPPVSGG